MTRSWNQPRRVAVHVGAVLIALSSAACTGVIGDAHQGPTGSGPTGGSTGTGTGGGNGWGLLGGRTPDQVLSTCTMPSPGRSPLRRLSNAEYRNTLSDLFAPVPTVATKVAAVTQDLPSEPESLGFRNSADYLVVQSLGAQKYLDAAEQLAETAAQSPSLVTCPATPDATCASNFVRSFGKKAYRRPLTDPEVALYDALYQKAVTSGYDFKTGIEWIVFSMLQSQPFLYRFEFSAAPTGTVAAPTAHEMASRLSYLFWQSMPDDALLGAADRGELTTPAQIEAQARRMLADPKADRMLEYFDQWMDLDVVQDMERNASVYPNIDPTLPQLLLQETHAFVSGLLHDPNGNFDQLLTAPYTFANASLAKHYGVTGPTGTAFERIDIAGRSGILTQGMLLAHDKATRTSIVRRGLKVRIDLLCQEIPAPPPNVDINLDGLGPNLTQRQKLEQHRQNASCAGCHNLMDPVGVVFEGFDAVGRARTIDETGAAVETASTLADTFDANGPVANPSELGHRLADSEEVRQCYARQSFRFFYGREFETADACSMARMLKDFNGSGHNLSELLVSLARTDAFLYRSSPEVTP